MRIAMIGTGYVGLVSGACFSDFGFTVTCVDKDEQKIQTLNNREIPIFEQGLKNIVTKNIDENRLFFSTDLKKSVKNADVVFIAIGTPSRKGDGQADLTHVFEAAKEIAASLSNYTVIVVKSTVPVGTGQKVEKLIKETNPRAEFSIVSNPEFLREGSAVEDFKRPDRVVVGLKDKKAKEIMHELYRPLFLFETPMVYTNIETSELIKYASNAFLATKISFINEMANLCEKVGADVQELAQGMGLDKRIGNKFLHPGPGYGGSCFPKDTRALVQTAIEHKAPTKIVEAVVDGNNLQKQKMVDKIVNICETVENKKLAILGITFKPNTDDIREAASLEIIPSLLKLGAKISAFDPEGMNKAKSILPDISWSNDPYEAMANADAVVILTEWNMFRALDLKKVKSLLKTPLMVDLRNIYSLEVMKKLGFTYASIGRPTITSKSNVSSLSSKCVA